MTDPQNSSPAETPVESAAPKDAPHVASVLRLAGGMQRYAVVLAAVAAVAVVVAGFVVAGGSGGVGAIVGAVLAGALGWLGTFVMVRTARATPIGVMAGALTAFAGKIVFLLVFLLAFNDTTLFDNRWFAYALFAVTAAWIVGEVVGFVRTRIPVVDI